MSAVGRIVCRELRNKLNIFKPFRRDARYSSTAVPSAKDTSTQEQEQRVEDVKVSRQKLRGQDPPAPAEYRFIYPEFLPDPEATRRNHLREKLERMDMMARRSVIDIPEFYVGSILAVTHAEPHAPGKTNRFVGICIDRKGCGLRASFILRNVVDHQGIEVLYQMYDPAIQQIQCLRLEKRLDDKLFYLRDAPLEYSTFPFDMEMEFLPENSPVPVNTLQVPLKPPPWLERWERQELKGVRDLQPRRLTEKRRRKAEASAKPWEKYDLMKIYRETIPEEEQQKIYSEVYNKLHSLELSRKKLKRKRAFVRPTKTG